MILSLVSSSPVNAVQKEIFLKFFLSGQPVQLYISVHFSPLIKLKQDANIVNQISHLTLNCSIFRFTIQTFLKGKTVKVLVGLGHLHDL